MSLPSLTLPQSSSLHTRPQDLAHHFFARCLEAKVVPYVVTKKTVFKWQVGLFIGYTLPRPGLR